MVKLVLQAFQMSVPCCLTRSLLPMMRRQLVLRTMAAAKEQQQVRFGAGRRRFLSWRGPNRSRHTVSGRAEPRLERGWAGRRGCRPPSQTGRLLAPPKKTRLPHSRRAARALQTHPQAWFHQEYQACLADAASPPPGPAAAGSAGGAAAVLHLLSRTASLQQAGGVSLMALRGHTGAVRRVCISPDGRDVLTASDDGAVQVGAGGAPGFRRARHLFARGRPWDPRVRRALARAQLARGRLCIKGRVRFKFGNLNLNAIRIRIRTQIWDMDIGDCVMQLRRQLPPGAPTPRLTALAMTPDGISAVTGDEAGVVCWWELSGGGLLRSVTAHGGR